MGAGARQPLPQVQLAAQRPQVQPQPPLLKVRGYAALLDFCVWKFVLYDFFSRKMDCILHAVFISFLPQLEIVEDLTSHEMVANVSLPSLPSLLPLIISFLGCSLAPLPLCFPARNKNNVFQLRFRSAAFQYFPPEPPMSIAKRNIKAFFPRI